MLKLLENLQNGFESTKSFQAAVTNHRITNLALSNHTSFEQFHTNGITALDIDKIEERYLISGSKNGALSIHDLQNNDGRASYTCKIVAEVPRGTRYSHKFSIDTVQWYPFDTGLFITSSMDCVLKIWDANSMKPAEKFKMANKIKCHHMSPIATQHSLIAIAMEYPHAVLLDPRSGSFSHELRGHKQLVSCLQWSPSCQYLLATAGADSKIFFWDIRSARGYLTALDQHNGEAQGSKKDLITAHNGAVNGLCFTDDGLHLVSCGTDCRIRLWDVALSSNTLVNYGQVANNNQFRNQSMTVCCDSDPPVLFIPSSNYVYAFDLFSGDKILTLVGHFSSVYCCVYRSCANQLLSGGNDMNILLWTPDVQQELNEENQECSDNEGPASPVNSDAWSDVD